MEIIERMKSEIVSARQHSDEVCKNVLQVALGEIELVQSRTGVKPPNDIIFSIIRKMITSNNEVIAEYEKRGSIGNIAKLEEENEILSEYIPQQMTVLDLVLDERIREKVKADPSKNVGKLIGDVIAYCKGIGRHADGKDVKRAIETLRTEAPE